MTIVAKRVFKNSVWLYSQMGITFFLTLYTTRVILSSLGELDFGIYNIVGGAISMLGFINAAMAVATQRFMSYAEGENSPDKKLSIFNISIIIHLILALVVSLILLSAIFLFFNSILNIPANRRIATIWVYFCLVISTGISIITVPYEAVLNSRENLRIYAIVGIIEAVLKCLIATVCSCSKSFDKLVLYSVLMMVIPLIRLFFLGEYCHHRYYECQFRIKSSFDRKLAKKMYSFAGWNLLTTSTAMVSQYGLGLVLNNFFGVLLNAAQGIANQISGQLMACSNTMLKALNPVIVSSEGSGKRSQMLFATMEGCKFSFLLYCFFFVPVFLETPYLFSIWLKEVPEWAVLFTRLQLIRILIEQLTLTIGSAINAQGEIKSYSIAKGLIFILPLIITVLLFKAGLAPYWMYIVWIVCWSVIGGFITLSYAIRLCKLQIKQYLGIVFIPCFSVSVISMGLGCLPCMFMAESPIRLLACLIVSFLSFILSLWVVGLRRIEREQVCQILSPIVHTLLRLARKTISILRRRSRTQGYMKGTLTDDATTSKLIADLLSSDKPCMIARYGSTECTCIRNYLSIIDSHHSVWKYLKSDIMEWWWNPSISHQMSSCAGFFPSDDEHLTRFAKRMLEDSALVDVLGSWSYAEEDLRPFLNKDFQPVLLRSLEPWWNDSDPWTKVLEGKKILIVHPFAELILNQYGQNRQKLFKNEKILPQFDLQYVTAVQSIGGKADGFNDWFAALEYMQNEIDSHDYDICLIGCGAYGFLLAAHVKRSGKKAVHLGGVLQILFGIIGKRWENPHYGVEEWCIPEGFYSSMINEFWTRPGDEFKNDSTPKVENGCYW